MENIEGKEGKEIEKETIQFYKLHKNKPKYKHLESVTLPILCLI